MLSISHPLNQTKPQSASIDLPDSPIAFHRVFVAITGSVTAALMLSQAWYWTQRTDDCEGWFYKSAKDWEKETGLTRREQDTARRRLRETGFWIEELRRVPATIHFRIDTQKLAAALNFRFAESANPVCTNPPIQFAQIRQTGLHESANPVCTNPPNKSAQKRQTIKEQRLHRDYTEITPESCAEAPPAGKTIRSKSSSSTESVPPVIAAIREITNRYPPKVQWEEIVDKFGDNFDREFMRECFSEWSKRSTNLGRTGVWLFEWCLNGQIPEQGGHNDGKKNGNRKTAGDKITTGDQWIFGNRQ